MTKERQKETVFESGDNLSEMAENLLKKKGMTLDEYLKGER